MQNAIMKTSDDLYRQLWEQSSLGKRKALARAYDAEREARAAWKAYDKLKKRVAFGLTILLTIANVALYVMVLR